MTQPLQSDVERIEIDLFLEAIHRKYGYDLRGYAEASLRRRVLLALGKSGHPNLGSLQHAVLSDAGLFASVFEDLTVRVSEMFRDPPVHRALREHVVPSLQTYPLVRVWHCGCAAGEEVYANAILMREEGLEDRAQLYATDVSPQAVEHARAGVFSAIEAERFSANYLAAGGKRRLDDYYTAAYGRIAIDDSLRRNILFFAHNLVSDDVFGEMQLVFCRNVLIYFGDDLKRRALTKLANSLCPGGFLCLGTSERIPPSFRLPFHELARDERIYRYEP